jgi:hypothetical protein
MAEQREIGTYEPGATQQKFHDALNGTGEFSDVRQYYAGKDPVTGEEIWWPGYKHVCLMGGIGSGKTWAAIAQGVHCSLEWPGNIGVVARRYASDLETTVKKMYFRYMDEFGIPYEEHKQSRLVKIFTPTTKYSEVYFWGLDESERIGSNEIGWYHLEEASDLPDGDAFRRLGDRLRFPWKMPPLSAAAIRQKVKMRPRAPYRRMGFVTANPPDEDHWLADHFPEPEMIADGKHKLPQEHILFQVNSYENEKNLPPGYLQSREANMPPSWRRVYIMGKYGYLRTGKPVYQGFEESVHAPGKLAYNQYTPVIRAWDFGRTHPCVVWSQIDNNGRWFILKCLMESDMILENFIPIVLARSAEWFPNASFKDCCDIAGSQTNDKSDKTSIQMLRESGIDPLARRCSRAIDGPDITRVQKMINKLVNGKPALMVDEDCGIIKRGLGGGYQVGKDGKHPAEDGFYEHPMDCIKYTAANFLESESVMAARNIQIEGPRWGW